MSKPILLKIGVFDGNKDATILFVSYDTITKVKYIVYDNDTGDIKYSGELSDISGLYYRSFIIPGGTIARALLPYYMKIQVMIDDSYSELSNAVLFYSHPKPTLLLDSFTTPLPSLDYSFTASYSYNLLYQELLSYYKFKLYDRGNNLIDETDKYYDDNCDTAYNISCLKENTVYRIQVIGETINGYKLELYVTKFTTALLNSDYQFDVNVSNDKQNAAICIELLTLVPAGWYQIRRKKSDALKWTTLDIFETTESQIISYTDYYAAGRSTDYTYSIIPTVDGMPVAINQLLINSDFYGALICDIDTQYRILLDPMVTSITRNRPNATITTIGSKYPFVYYGGELNYYSGLFSATIIKYDGDDVWDFDGSITYRDEFADWLTNGEAKILKMEDGREWMIMVTDLITIDSGDHRDKVLFEFPFVEIGDVNSTDDLVKNGLINYSE